MIWNAKENKFSYNVDVGKEFSIKTTIAKLTKRVILSNVAGVFDPIGAAAAILV